MALLSFGRSGAREGMGALKKRSSHVCEVYGAACATTSELLQKNVTYATGNQTEILQR